jgi:hypothetical protein
MTVTRAELERQLVEAQKALKEKATFEASASKVELGLQYTMVPIRNYGGTDISIEYEYKGVTKVLQLGTRDPKDLGAIPVETWIELERTSKLVADGYIARTDVPCTNPNVVVNDDSFIKGNEETELVHKISEMTNVHVLQRLLRVVEATGSKSGKYLSAASTLRQRIFDVTETFRKDEKTGALISLNTGIRVVEEEE